MTPLKAIVKFNLDRNLTTYDRETELNMLMEEFQELINATSVENEYETIDALCDIIVVATGSIYKLGYDPDEALEETLKEITSRQGELNLGTGKWEKDKNQDPNSLYKANYTLAKR